jgi:hypothetical protein
MNLYEWAETILFFVVLLAVIKPFGTFMAHVYQGERTFLSPVLVPCENLLYRLCGVERDEEMGWQRYAVGLLLFNLVCGMAIFAILLLQGVLPLNPQKLPAFSWHLALNTAVSFMTNTNWQNYSGEQAASYFTQMFGFTVHNFASAATGIDPSAGVEVGRIEGEGDAADDGNFPGRAFHGRVLQRVFASDRGRLQSKPWHAFISVEQFQTGQRGSMVTVVPAAYGRSSRFRCRVVELPRSRDRPPARS